MKRPYLFVVDADGAEVPDTRRFVGDLDFADTRALRSRMQAVLGDGCSVEIRL